MDHTGTRNSRRILDLLSPTPYTFAFVTAILGDILPAVQDRFEYGKVPDAASENSLYAACFRPAVSFFGGDV